MQLDAVGREVLQLHHLAPPRLAQVHQRPRVLLGRDDRDLEVGLLDRLDLLGHRQPGRVVDDEARAVRPHDAVLDARRGRDERQVELPLQPLPHDLHVQQAEEAAAEAEAERARGLRHVRDRRVVQAQPLEALPQVLEVVAVHGVEAAEDHRLGRAVAGQRQSPGPSGLGDGLADAGLPDVLDAGDEVPDLAGSELGDRGRDGQADADLVGLVDRPGLDEPHPAVRAQPAVDDPDGAHDASVLVVLAVEDEGLERRLGITDRRGDALDHGVQQLSDALAGLGREPQDLVGRDAEHGLDLLARSGRDRRPGGRSC